MAQPKHGHGDRGGNCGHHDPQNAAGDILAKDSLGKQAAQDLFKKGDQLADAHHRVGDAVRISHHQIDAEARREG